MPTKKKFLIIMIIIISVGAEQKYHSSKLKYLALKWAFVTTLKSTATLVICVMYMLIIILLFMSLRISWSEMDK